MSAVPTPSPCPLTAPDNTIYVPNSVLLSLAARSANDVWGVGYYTDGSNGVEHSLVDHWNGKTWASIPTPNSDCRISNELRSVAASGAKDAWAVGVVTHRGGPGDSKPLTEHWDGSSWSIVPTPAIPGGVGELDAVADLDSSDVWAVGSYVGARAYPQTLIEHWDGRVWSIVPSPSQAGVESSLRAVVPISRRDVWAGGQWGTFEPQAPLLLHWNGASWSSVSGAAPPSELFGRWVGARVDSVGASGPRDLWAVGTFFDESGTDNGYTLAEHWDGSKWSLTPVDKIIPSPISHWFQAVVAFSPMDAWAVDQQYVKHWDGARWSLMTKPPMDTLFSGVAGSGPADVWVVGYGSLIEHWNGKAWTVVPPPAPYWRTVTPSSP